MLTARETEDGVSFQVRVSPGASRSAILGLHDGALKLSLAAPPVEGAANAALRELLARKLKVPRRAVTIVRGQQSRDKTVSVRGVSLAQLHALISVE